MKASTSERGKVQRRALIQAGSVALGLFGLGAVGRALVACAAPEPTIVKKSSKAKPAKTPTDDDEYEEDDGTTPSKGDGEVPTVPNRTWEARVKQLEGEQSRLYGAVFTMTAPGVFAGKERSHVPTLTIDASGKVKKAKILVEHAMGANKPDAGTPAPTDAAPPPAPDAAAPAADAAAGPVHYISTMWLRAEVDGQDTVVGLWEFTSTDPAPPSVLLALPEGITSVVAYEWCTLHGMWKSDPVAL